MRKTYLGQVNGLQRKLPQTFTSVDIRLGGTRDTTTTKFRSNSILGNMSEWTIPLRPVTDAYLVIYHMQRISIKGAAKQNIRNSPILLAPRARCEIRTGV